MEEYERVLRQAPNPVGRRAVIDYLHRILPDIWAARYRSKGGELLTVTLGGKPWENGAVSTLFDQQPDNSPTDSRVVAVWGLSKPEPSGTRDTGRMAGFLKHGWAKAYPGRDRGHFFAHTMGGGTDINLFPQLALVNRGGEWRRMETFAAENPGTFCFIHPIYSGPTWTPSKVEYGIFTLPPDRPFKFWGNTFKN